MSKMERTADIVARVQAGETYEAIGRSWGVTRARIQQICKREGVASTRKWNGVYRAALPRETREQAKALYHRGMRFAHIAEVVDASPETVREIAIRECGYVPGPRGEEWPEKHIALLKRHWLKPGWPASRIGAAINRTRNSVIGKAHRLGL